MPERGFESIRLPFKFFTQQRPGLAQNATMKHMGRGAASMQGLSDVTGEVFGVQTEDHRNDWLTLERWAERQRDWSDPGETSVGVYPIPAGVTAFYASGAEIPFSAAPGVSVVVFVQDWQNLIPAAGFSVNATGPLITAPGTYALNTTWHYATGVGPDPVAAVSLISTPAGFGQGTGNVRTRLTINGWMHCGFFTTFSTVTASTQLSVRLTLRDAGVPTLIGGTVIEVWAL